MPIDRDDISRLKEIFVPRAECNEITDELKADLANERTERKLIGQSVDNIKKILWIIATASIGTLIASIWNVIASYGG